MVVLPKHVASYGRQWVAVLDGKPVCLSVIGLIFIALIKINVMEFICVAEVG
jgi:hypothetical protein